MKLLSLISWHASAQARDVERFNVMGCLPPPLPDEDHPDAPRNLRGMVRDLLRSSWWENLVFLAILVSSILLALQVKLLHWTGCARCKV